MRIAPASDLHMEVSTFKPTSAMKNADVIVLAGDIAQGMAGLEWAAKQDKPVVYVNGNHEYDYNDVITLEQEMRDFCKVHVVVKCIIASLIEIKAICYVILSSLPTST